MMRAATVAMLVNDQRPFAIFKEKAAFVFGDVLGGFRRGEGVVVGEESVVRVEEEEIAIADSAMGIDCPSASIGRGEGGFNEAGVAPQQLASTDFSHAPAPGSDDFRQGIVKRRVAFAEGVALVTLGMEIAYMLAVAVIVLRREIPDDAEIEVVLR